MAEQSPDPWRILWRFATSNAVLVALLLVIAAGVTLTAWIPQQPSAAADYARWRSQTQARFGETTSFLQALGLFNIISSLGFRALLALLSGSLFLRLVEGVDRLQRDRETGEPDGEWQAVSDEQFPDLLGHLRRRRYRVVNASSFFQVDRWPWSGALSLMAHLGGLLVMFSLLLSHLFGWQVGGLILQGTERRSLRGDAGWVMLTENGSATRQSPGVVAFIEESGPGVRVSAVDADGEALPLLLTADAEPRTELTLALREATYFAIPEAELIVRLAPQSEEPYSRADVQIYGSPSGQEIAQRVTDQGGQATFEVRDVILTFVPAPYARVTATYNPGRWPAVLGIVILVVGIGGSLICPGRRFWLREREETIEGAGSIPSWLRDEEEEDV